MEYLKATNDMVDSVNEIFQLAIKTVYPKYYPKEVVDFFLNHHSKEHTAEGIATGNMYVLVEEEKIIGVGCYDQNHITGVYVHPEYQKKGYGTFIMQKLEDSIKQNYDVAILESSLAAVFMYEKRGYKTVSHGFYDLENDVKLVYEVMEKKLR